VTITSHQSPRARPDTTPSVIAVLRAAIAHQYAPVVEVLTENCIGAVELTMSTPNTLDVLADVRAAAQGTQVGVGTVTTVEQMRQLLEIGVDFVVTPITDVRVIAIAVDAGVPIYPGGLTPTELWTGWEAGATAVKVFPASVVGPEYISALRGPFPDIEVVPSGGIGAVEAGEWIRAGACSVSVGGPLIGDALRGGSLTELAQRCRDLNAVVTKAKAQR
jgi:2-dehydro-3-deoxyphosphogluconate aldolase / (4S)-4-hydroxy-2-oxoglutarate aldolase